MRNGQAVAFGGVVAVDRVEVFEHQEGRAGRAGRRHEAGRSEVVGQRRSVDLAQAAHGPFADRPSAAPAFAFDVEPARQLHFETPGLAALPAGLGEEVGGGGERVGGVVHQVALAVTVAIDGEALEGGGHELCVAEGAGPRADQALGRDVTGLQDAHGGIQLAAEEGLAPAVAGQRAECLHQRVLAQALPEVALHTPDRHHSRRLDAEALLHARQRVRVLPQHGLSLLHALVVDQAAEVVPDRCAELGLVVELLDHAHVGHHTSREQSVAGFGDAGRAGFALQAVEAAGEVGRGGGGGLCEGWQGYCQGCGEEDRWQLKHVGKGNPVDGSMLLGVSVRAETVPAGGLAT